MQEKGKIVGEKRAFVQVTSPKHPTSARYIMKPSSVNGMDSIDQFELDYGSIPDLISCRNVTLYCNALKSVISPRSWIDDSTISAFFGLIEDADAVAFDATFFTLLRRAKHQKAIQSASEFFRYHYSASAFALLTFRLHRCKIVLIPLFNGDHTGNGNHWGLASLEKLFGTIRVYDSLNNLNSFADILPDIKRLAESLTKGCTTQNCEWPETWSISPEILSIQQNNSDDCGVFTMLNAFLSQEIF